MDAWNYVRDCDLDKFSCIVAVGGDGTIHEVVNGLMVRQDCKKVPLAFIPNGSGNDTCGAIGVHSIDQALAYLKKADTMKIDLNRIIIDANSLEELSD
jgi:diacylglycerol kinase family enzyme